MATLINIDGSRKEVFPLNRETGFTLAELYELIDCEWIEAVGPLPEDGRYLIIDEEGKLTGKEHNEAATQIFQANYDTSDTIVGIALLADEKEFQ